MRYQDIYPSKAILKSQDLNRVSASDLMTLEYFEAEPAEMPYEVFEQHHILLNLKDEPMRVLNFRDEEEFDFTYSKNEIVVTPAGVKSGWKWFEKSKCIVVTLDPHKFESFSQIELGIPLQTDQLKSIQKFLDEDITNAAIQALEALETKSGSVVLYESFSRVFLTKLINKYALKIEDYDFSKSFSSDAYKEILNYLAENFQNEVSLEDLASQVNISPYHFSRLFKKTIGMTPYQFVMNYRIEKSKNMLLDKDKPIFNIALLCGFSDQAHFSRVFKKIIGQSPNNWRKAQ